MMSWSRTEIYNLVGDLYSHMRKALGRNIKEMHRIMNYFVAPTNRVLYLEPNCKWYGKYKSFGFLNSGGSDTYLAEFKYTRRSVTSYSI